MRFGTRFLLVLTAAGAACALAGCGDGDSGPVEVVTIGSPPRLVNPNREPLDASAAFLMQAAAQGLVRFDAAGEIEPALAQRWTVSDDGLRYTFRLARAEWPGGGRITARQVVARLRAAASPASRNPVKPILGAIGEVTAMTDEVLEISLKSPRPGFLQLLAQPEMAVLRDVGGSGPYRMSKSADGGGILLSLPKLEDEDEEARRSRDTPPIVLHGAAAPEAVARFAAGSADLVTGGTAGDLAVARAARQPGNRLVFDPVAGLFGLSFGSVDGVLGQAEARQALAMAIDRPGLIAAFGAPGAAPAETILPAGTEGIAQPAAPAWAPLPLDQRRALAAATFARLSPERLRVRVALPDGPGWRLLFAHLRRDWAAVGVEASQVAANAPAELRLIDEVAPVTLASWYLRHFACDASRVCDPAADELLAAARLAPTPDNRRALLATADRIISDAAPFIPLGQPVRWSLVSPRLTGFRPNRFARHPAGELIRQAP
ncbi:MAG TPA: ABC transporter substrate-binding protein [Allosphingosinicella sp.]|jgi:peptide/nickel transport system substrate-binding protein